MHKSSLKKSYFRIYFLGKTVHRSEAHMLKRKIEQTLTNWKHTPNHKPLIIKGPRQCGKTFSVLDFTKKHYRHTVYLNFFENPDYASVFSGSLEVDNIVMFLSALLGDQAIFEAGETVLVLDEIQNCPEARTSFKFFHADGRYDVIGTGSLLGIKGYGEKPACIPVGSETIVDMYPLDFEEFLWANKISKTVIDMLKKCLDTEMSVPQALHLRMKQLLQQYAVVGGMPDAVQTFVDTRQMNEVLRIQRDIVRTYEDDMLKYAEKKDRACIRECFRSIPIQLSKENKKFQYSVIKKGAPAAKYAGCLKWLEDAGIIARCYGLSATALPLSSHVREDVFKVYMRDCGLFVSMLEDGTQYDILHGRFFDYNGAVFENLMADILTKMGRRLYYFRKSSGLEADFFIRYKGKCTLLDGKSATGNTKNIKTILRHPEEYHINSAIRLGNCNIRKSGQILSLPYYMVFLLRTC